MSAVTVRPAVPGDLTAIHQISRQTWQDHQTRHPYAFAPGLWDNELGPGYKAAVESANGPNQTLFVAERAGEFCGYALLSWSARSDVGGYASVSIDDIGVVAETRGMGVGKQLINFVKDRAEDEDWDNLTAQVWTGNDSSAALFHSAGFTRQSQIFRWGPMRPARARPPRRNKWPAWVWASLMANGLLLIILLQQFWEWLAR